MQQGSRATTHHIASNTVVQRVASISHEDNAVVASTVSEGSCTESDVLWTFRQLWMQGAHRLWGVVELKQMHQLGTQLDGLYCFPSSPTRPPRESCTRTRSIARTPHLVRPDAQHQPLADIPRRQQQVLPLLATGTSRKTSTTRWLKPDQG